MLAIFLVVKHRHAWGCCMLKPWLPLSFYLKVGIIIIIGEIGKLKYYQLELGINPTVQPMQPYCAWYKTRALYPHTTVLG